MPATKQQIIDALRRFASQRPGLNSREYGDAAGYRQESRGIARDLNQARVLLRAIEWREGVSAAHIIEAARSAFSGRLSIDPETAGIGYVTGQYWPTEYRRAVCAVCASALWGYMRDSCMPADNEIRSPSPYFRRLFRNEFGRAIAERWFN